MFSGPGMSSPEGCSSPALLVAVDFDFFVNLLFFDKPLFLLCFDDVTENVLLFTVELDRTEVRADGCFRPDAVFSTNIEKSSSSFSISTASMRISVASVTLSPLEYNHIAYSHMYDTFS